jgi:hypothetical protein
MSGRPRVAVMISGFLRTLWFNYPNLMENLIEPNDADVFIYAGSNRALVPRAHKSCSSDYLRGGGQLDFDEKEFFGRRMGERLKAFRVVEDEFESYVEEYRSIFPICPYCRPRPGVERAMCPECRVPTPAEVRSREWHAVDSYLRLRRCNGLRREYEASGGFKYDVVVRIRGDMRLSFVLDLSGYKYRERDLHVEGTHDNLQRECVFFGARDIMDLICSRFVYEYGTIEGTDLAEFLAFLNRKAVRRWVYNSQAPHFLESPDYQRTRCARTGRQCTCCIYWDEVPLDPGNEDALELGVKASTIPLLVL